MLNVEIFVARQPIFTREEEVMGYELFYRKNHDDLHFTALNEDEATTDVIINSFYHIGYQKISQGKLCFINFTERLLKSEMPYIFSPNEVVIEILESVHITKEVIKICSTLKKKGYMIALDDYVFQSENPFHIHLLHLADIIKVDVRVTTIEQQQQLFELAHKHNLQLLAEKIETHQEYIQCKKRGYDYYQGFFFSKPSILSSIDIPTFPYKYLRLIQQLSEPNADIKKISDLVETDLSLTYKLLRLINSGSYKRVHTIHSVLQAIMLLGVKHIRKWLFVLTMKEMDMKQNPYSIELQKMALIRGSFCELYAQHTTGKKDVDDYFLVGMLSLLDRILHVPISRVIMDLPLEKEMKEALMGEQNSYHKPLFLVTALENVDWDQISEGLMDIKLPAKEVFQWYELATEWAFEVVTEEEDREAIPHE